jgi:hypothetical protein
LSKALLKRRNKQALSDELVVGGKFIDKYECVTAVKH